MSRIEICKKIQCSVSKLSENEIMELYKIIEASNSNYTKNNNGIFLNLNWVDDETLNKIDNYISFCIKSQNEISKYEIMKNLLNESIKIKDKTVDENVPLIESNEVGIQINNRSKCSSSMKFYLLKKKFLKQNTQQSFTLDNELCYEDYLLT